MIWRTAASNTRSCCFFLVLSVSLPLFWLYSRGKHPNHQQMNAHNILLIPPSVFLLHLFLISVCDSVVHSNLVSRTLSGWGECSPTPNDSRQTSLLLSYTLLLFSVALLTWISLAAHLKLSNSISPHFLQRERTGKSMIIHVSIYINLSLSLLTWWWPWIEDDLNSL